MPIKKSSSNLGRVYEFVRPWKPDDIIGVMVPFVIGLAVGAWSAVEGWFLLGGPLVVLGAAYSAYLIQGIVYRNRLSSVFVSYEPETNILSSTWPNGPTKLNQVALDKADMAYPMGKASRKSNRTGKVPILVIHSMMTELHIPTSVFAEPELDALVAPVVERIGTENAREALNSSTGRKFTW